MKLQNKVSKNTKSFRAEPKRNAARAAAGSPRDEVGKRDRYSSANDISLPANRRAARHDVVVRDDSYRGGVSSARKVSVSPAKPKAQNPVVVRPPLPNLPKVYYFDLSWHAFIKSVKNNKPLWRSAESYFVKASENQDEMISEFISHIRLNSAYEAKVKFYLTHMPHLTIPVDKDVECRSKKNWSEHWDEYLFADERNEGFWIDAAIAAISGARGEIRDNYQVYLRHVREHQNSFEKHYEASSVPHETTVYKTLERYL